MVRKAFLIIIIIFFILLTSSCFIIYTAFVYDSDIEERRLEMYNFTLLDTFPELDTKNAGYSFLLISDTHITDGKTDGLERLPGIIEDFNTNNTPEIKFALILGDITESASNSNLNVYINIANELADKGIPFYPLLGNHDLIGDGWKNWKNKIGSTNYRIYDKSNNATLIILDSASIYFGQEQLDWLERELKKDLTRDVFVFSHVPLFAPGLFQQIEMNERARMVSILQNKCDVFFAGHIHERRNQRSGNVDFVNIDSYRDNRSYCIVSVTDTGKISYTWGKF